MRRFAQPYPADAIFSLVSKACNSQTRGSPNLRSFWIPLGGHVPTAGRSVLGSNGAFLGPEPLSVIAGSFRMACLETIGPWKRLSSGLRLRCEMRE